MKLYINNGYGQTKNIYIRNGLCSDECQRRKNIFVCVYIYICIYDYICETQDKDIKRRRHDDEGRETNVPITHHLNNSKELNSF